MGVDCNSYRIPIHSSKIALVSFVLKFERDVKKKPQWMHMHTRSNEKKNNKQTNSVYLRPTKEKKN